MVCISPEIDKCHCPLSLKIHSVNVRLLGLNEVIPDVAFVISEKASSALPLPTISMPFQSNGVAVLLVSFMDAKTIGCCLVPIACRWPITVMPV